jgi:stearoyl-CoA desaturase (delta-9 desaturase)
VSVAQPIPEDIPSATPQRAPKSDIPTGIGLAIIHLGALLAFVPAFFSWRGVATALFLYWLTGCIGITLGYHRLLTHRSLSVPRWLEYVIVTCGASALQGGPIEWISNHRKHHAHTDRDGDPHDSNIGMGWAHIEWLYRTNKDRLEPEEFARWSPDLVSDRYYQFLERYAITLQIVFAGILLAFGGMTMLVWGFFVRLVLLYHCTWLVNSAAHASGYQRFRTNDRSTNCWWVAVLAFGEGWHNNHHAFPSSARHGMHWFEFDLTWTAIRLMRALGIARNVKVPTPEMLNRIRLPQPRRLGSSG